MNLPNKITVVRVFLIPFFLFFMLTSFVPNSHIIACVIFCVASASDFLDGYLARKNNLVTDFGKFMDPLADKLLVCSALICFVDFHLIPTWIAVVIIAREFIISGFRLIAVENNIVIAANIWGKIKTVVQLFMCIFLIADIESPFFDACEQILIYAATALTIISLVDYVYKNRKVLMNGTK